MLKFAARLGFAFLAITTLTVASPRLTYKTVADTRISSVIDRMMDFVAASRELILGHGTDNRAGVYSYLSMLKAVMARQFSNANITNQHLAESNPLGYKTNKCHFHIGNLSAIRTLVEHEVDNCTITIVLSAAQKLSAVVKSVSEAVRELNDLKTKTDSCENSQCPEITDAVARIESNNVKSMNDARNDYLTDLEDIESIKECVQTNTHYREFSVGAAAVATLTKVCILQSEQPSSV